MRNQFNEIKTILQDPDLSLDTEKYTTLLELLEKAEEDSFYNRIGLLFDNCDRIRNSIELLDGMSQREFDNKHTDGIVYSKKIMLFLLHDFSSGKTTFIRRLIGKLTGVSSQFPQTSSIIRHFGSSSKMKIVTPSITYTPPSALKFDFIKMLRKFGIEKNFVQKGDVWNIDGEGISITDWSEADIIDFIGTIDRYPGFILRIDWGHTFSNKSNKYSILDYVDIYDVPGIGGELEHEKIISGAIDSCADIIIYLLDPERSIPGESEEKTLIDIAQRNSKTRFYWCYQKLSSEKEHDFIEAQEKELGIFVSKMLEKAMLATSCPPNIQLLSEFFYAASVIDAMGDQDDNLKAIDTICNIISNHFITKSRSYITEKKLFLTDIPTFPEILQTLRPDDFVIERMQKLALSNEVTIADLKNMLDEIFQRVTIDTFIEKQYTFVFSNSIREDVRNAVADLLLKSVSVGALKFSLIKMALGKNLVDTTACDFNFLKRGAREYFAADDRPQMFFPHLQAYLLYILFAKNELKHIYLKDIESHIIKQLELEVDLLERKILE
jgi:hypothetical protein